MLDSRVSPLPRSRSSYFATYQTHKGGSGWYRNERNASSLLGGGEFASLLAGIACQPQIGSIASIKNASESGAES